MEKRKYDCQGASSKRRSNTPLVLPILVAIAPLLDLINIDRLDLCKVCQVDEFIRGLHYEDVAIKTSADSNDGDNTTLIDGNLVVGDTQVVDGN